MIKTATKPEEQAFQTYKNLLLNKKAELQVALEVNSHHLAAPAEDAHTDPGQLLQEELVTVEINQALYSRLKEVTEALDRLHEGEYGSCLACGEPITHKRLQAIPWARHCLSCAEKNKSLYSGEAAREHFITADKQQDHMAGRMN